MSNHSATDIETDILIDIRGLTKTYGSGEAETKVLRGLDFTVKKGSVTALLGPSGSGKSTLLTILGSLLKPTDGDILMLGENLSTIEDPELSEFRNRHIGFIFQFHHLLPDFTALENVMFPAAGAEGLETGAMKRRAKELLERVGLSNRVNYRANELSGGQKQRVAIARALMNSPDLLLADEPTGNLDRENADQVMRLLLEINKQDGMTCIISTHADDIASRCRDRIEIIDGRLKQ
jgi:lipoprotein-releasing system ATP-binding protein